MSPRAPRRLVVIVSYYDARPASHLHALLRQLRLACARLDQSTRGAWIGHVLVVVNSVAQPCEPLDLSSFPEVRVLPRPNAGFNIGAWEHGWRSDDDADGYVFLQDECELRDADALCRYAGLMAPGRADTLLGESLQLWRDWPTYARVWPEGHARLLDQARAWAVPLGPTPSHLQTLALGASRRTMQKLGGFLCADEKLAAIGTEVLLSCKARAAGIALRQTGWRPFTWIRHAQWDSESALSADWRWSARRVLKLAREAWMQRNR